MSEKIGTLKTGRLIEGGRLIQGRYIQVRLYFPFKIKTYRLSWYLTQVSANHATNKWALYNKKSGKSLTIPVYLGSDYIRDCSAM